MQFNKKTLAFSAIIVLLVASNLLTLAWLKNKSAPTLNTFNQWQSATTTPRATTTTIIDNPVINSTSTVLANQIEIVWNEWPAKVRAINDVFDYAIFDKECKKIKSEFSDANDVCDRSYNSIKAYSVGKVAAGQYAGGELFLVSETPEGPAFRDNYFRIVRLGTSTIFLASSSEPLDYSPLIKAMVRVDTRTMISNLEPPLEIAVPNSSYKLKRAIADYSKYLMADYKNPKKVFEYEPGKLVYLDETLGCYLVGAPDGSVRQYDYALPFVVKIATTSEMAGGTIEQEFDSLKFTDQSEFTNEAYNIKPVGGCGSSGCLDYASFIKKGNSVAQSLKSVAVSRQGELFYEFTDLNISFTAPDRFNGNLAKKQTAKEYLQGIYDLYIPAYNSKAAKPGEKITFAEFLKKHPLLFWLDPLGNYVQLTRAEFAPGVECGKPVIYLYPQKTTTVSVQVRPNGGITKSDPAYGAGWNVQAEPTGQLKNLADQKTYDSLFWEGAGINYLAPTEGFVVAKKDVEKFLIEKLAKLGLNKKETADFMVFWLPRMQSDNFYFVSFVSQREFDRLAPLTIEPKPDTIIRIFMDYKALASPINVKEPIIKTPVRRGFTVVEWGGAIR